MPTGIRAELAFESPDACRITQYLGDAGDAKSISWSVAPESGRITEEFAVEGDPDIEEATQVFSYGDRSVYRFQREQAECCPCGIVQDFDVPVRDVRTVDGTLHFAIYVEDMDELREVVIGVRNTFPDVRIVRIVRAQEAGEGDLVLVDRGELTDRQREVLETAHRLGYFDHPKGANAGEVADELGITTSTFTEHLAAAQSKLLNSILA
ncbi:helix-turn-helix domain-containing protein [Halodesulfurarchaeum formicicum]|uniref:Bacterio-opsin activator HTH domain-containing protein n=1 Tax=Halodesulfurarchaeum formicicum TaxID=1873524 RepID=A0A1J1A9F2_9EURY|nr:helix-turn-helix domain-containing protein [Halodesulfurarchaeum formicicum]APE94533.1 bacterio-opsin activator HTH domain-containing protein [Halodesulfurarchaeum formicicum]